jgi:POT family proton-dependent oligopeptide transporter
LFFAQKQAELEGTVGPGWLVGVYLLHTLGELCLSPIGLSMVTKLAPVRVASLMMGIWFIANGVANYFAGRLEGLLATVGFPIYGFLIASSIGAGLLLLALTPLLRHWMHGKA